MTLDDFLNGSWTVRDLRAGPFRDCIDLYAARLRKDGYSTVTARYSVRIVNCFIQWMIRHRFDRGDISDQLVDRFFRDEDRGCGLRGGDPAGPGQGGFVRGPAQAQARVAAAQAMPGAQQRVALAFAARQQPDHPGQRQVKRQENGRGVIQRHRVVG